MRARNVFLSMTVLAVGGLLAATTATADGPVPTSCVTGSGNWTVTLVNGPSVAIPPAGVSCPVSGSCVQATYTVTGTLTANLVVGLMPTSLVAVTGTDNPTGNQTYAPAQGDPVFGLGFGDLSRDAFKANPNATTTTYQVWLDGSSFSLGLGPVIVKQGSKGGSVVQGACALAVPDVAQAAPNPLATFASETHETLGGKCHVVVRTNKQTGVTTVTQDGSNSGCVSIEGPFPVGSVNVQVTTSTGTEIGPVELSEGFNFILGIGSCTYKQYYPTTGPIYKICY